MTGHQRVTLLFWTIQFVAGSVATFRNHGYTFSLGNTGICLWLELLLYSIFELKEASLETCKAFTFLC